MIREQVDKMLKDYKSNLGRIGHLAIRISELQDELASCLANAEATLTVLGAANTDGMPHGTKVGNPTERIGIELAMGYVPREADDIQREINDLEDEVKSLKRSVGYVKAWMLVLDDKERWVIERHVLDGTQLVALLDEYCTMRNEIVSFDTLRRYKREGMAKIYEAAR